MEFILEEQFLKEDKKVQLELVRNIDLMNSIIVLNSTGKQFIFDNEFFDGHGIDPVDEETGDLAESFLIDYTPLLCEGQLRKYIEDKTGCRILTDYNDEEGYSVWLYCEEGELKNKYRKLGEDLLQAYWQVVVQIVKESIDK